MAVSKATRCTCVFALLSALCVIANAAVHGEIAELHQNCQDRMSLIYTSYYSDERSASVNCSSMIRLALSDGGLNCPSENILQSCFQVIISSLHVFQNIFLVSCMHIVNLSVYRICERKGCAVSATVVHISVHHAPKMTSESLTVSNALQRARKAWVKFSQDCELFSAPPLCKGVQGECKKPGYAPPPILALRLCIERAQRVRARAKVHG